MSEDPQLIDRNDLRAEGAAAYAAGKKVTANPYGLSAGYRSHCWTAGWRAARNAKRKAREIDAARREMEKGT